MTTFTADNMELFLGTDSNDTDAQIIGEYLESHGWDLSMQDGRYHAYRDDEEMTETEWQTALNEAFTE